MNPLRRYKLGGDITFFPSAILMSRPSLLAGLK
jgi:hypothetical protein